VSVNSCPELERPAHETLEYEATPLFTFLHGSWHRAKHFDPLRRRLEARGAHTEAIDLPIDVPDVNIDELAVEVAARITLPEMTSLWVHSRAGNLGPRIAAVLEDMSTPLSHLGYLNSGFEWTNDHYFGGGDEAKVPTKYTSFDFRRHLKPYGPDPRLTIYDRRFIRKHLYNDCPRDLANWAIDNMRPQYRGTEPLMPVPKWPSTPSSYIIAKKDRIISPRYSRYVASAVDASVEEVPTGHSGYISHPELHADIMLGIAAKSLVSIKGIDTDEIYTG
jgi:hypothetical protein